MDNYSIKNIRKQFPILSRKINSHKFIYLDNAATVHKPIDVINTLQNFYIKNYATVHRGSYDLSINMTNNIEYIRKQIAKFINAPSSKEIIFTKSTTEGINFIANTWALQNIKYKHNIIISEMEHHSNILPWQILSKKIGFTIKIIPLTFNGELNISKLYKLIDQNTKLISLTYISNVLGTINPIKKIIALARKKNIITLIDGAQAIANININIQDLNCDFFVFSGHKIFGPTGIGVLWGKKEILESISPWEFGGGMIKYFNKFQDPIWEQVPWKFEAGTPNISGIIGLSAALKWFKSFDINKIITYNKFLTKYTLEKLNTIPNIKIFGSNKLNNRIGIISFNINQHHAYDIGSFLDQYGIAIRTGHHCAIPVMNYYNVQSMCRISLSIYNNIEEIDVFIEKLIYINNLLLNKKL
ncbi:SufS family cysteine desulfurase [Enterobacteriaceae endosymbiont of Neohaemonia nigricornis]|uniref:SufS family cysteine desulfurase n=1 Tax=Enterobacteriaceae endosymbiont of Neohaemonia nigricornis TaxID=2675792 RepID=UPI001449829B|nr:SufS family cysteine desulfurase [Enterobacteriaceae endosymbiont of Neohaemonia nigricornis]QJC30533.1 SufS family cysteine desulfurase [Enterobacteriaceae endosymbiont of Neohaemonia nigricornis]